MTNTEAPEIADNRPAVVGPVLRMVRPGAHAVARTIRQTSEDNYVSADGHRMQREHGLTPADNNIGGRWVLRGPDAEWIDCDQYRYDLLARHGFETA